MISLFEIYIYGCLTSILFAVLRLEDKNGKIEWIDFGFSVLLSFCSWITFFGLVVGYLIKQNNKKFNV